MPKREKKERGRPLKKRYPPRVDATPEEMAHGACFTQKRRADGG